MKCNRIEGVVCWFDRVWSVVSFLRGVDDRCANRSSITPRATARLGKSGRQVTRPKLRFLQVGTQSPSVAKGSPLTAVVGSAGPPWPMVRRSAQQPPGTAPPRTPCWYYEARVELASTTSEKSERAAAIDEQSRATAGRISPLVLFLSIGRCFRASSSDLCCCSSWKHRISHTNAVDKKASGAEGGVVAPRRRGRARSQRSSSPADSMRPSVVIAWPQALVHTLLAFGSGRIGRSLYWYALTKPCNLLNDSLGVAYEAPRDVLHS